MHNIAREMIDRIDAGDTKGAINAARATGN